MIFLKIRKTNLIWLPWRLLMFEKLKNLIIFICYFSISVPFIAYAFTRILINLIFQSINVLLLGINYGTYSLESYLAKQLKNNTRTAYQTLGKHTTAYGFIFIKNIPFYLYLLQPIINNFYNVIIL